MTTTDRLAVRLQKLPSGKAITLTAEDGTYIRQQSWRHAARKLGIPISIKTTPDGVKLWRK